MIYWMQRVTPAQALALCGNEDLADHFSDYVTGKYYEAARAHVAPATTDKANEVLSSLGTIADVLCLQKSWSLLGYLLALRAGSHTLWNSILFLGQSVGDNISGYGPGLLMDEQQVNRLEQALNEINNEEFIRRIDYRDMLDGQVYGVPQGGSLSDQNIEQELQKEAEAALQEILAYVNETVRLNSQLFCWLG